MISGEILFLNVVCWVGVFCLHPPHGATLPGTDVTPSRSYVGQVVEVGCAGGLLTENMGMFTCSPSGAWVGSYPSCTGEL